MSSSGSVGSLRLAVSSLCFNLWLVMGKMKHRVGSVTELSQLSVTEFAQRFSHVFELLSTRITLAGIEDHVGRFVYVKMAVSVHPPPPRLSSLCLSFTLHLADYSHMTPIVSFHH